VEITSALTSPGQICLVKPAQWKMESLGKSIVSTQEGAFIKSWGLPNGIYPLKKKALCGLTRKEVFGETLWEIPNPIPRFKTGREG